MSAPRVDIESCFCGDKNTAIMFRDPPPSAFFHGTCDTCGGDWRQEADLRASPHLTETAKLNDIEFIGGDP